ncbi:hypothetical protein OF83DRAFT_1088297 [Amylostereum chailletii]|nr:hypothetical protein OF83DRAFT_1088297 [Amylostereum chailletii]
MSRLGQRWRMTKAVSLTTQSVQPKVWRISPSMSIEGAKSFEREVYKPRDTYLKRAFVQIRGEERCRPVFDTESFRGVSHHAERRGGRPWGGLFKPHSLGQRGPQCSCLRVFHVRSNYMMKVLAFVEPDERKLLARIREELGVDKNVQAWWYFDSKAVWVPGIPVAD